MPLEDRRRGPRGNGVGGLCRIYTLAIRTVDLLQLAQHLVKKQAGRRNTLVDASSLCPSFAQDSE